jgi:hypothetical protein
MVARTASERTVVRSGPPVRVQRGFIMPSFWLGPQFHIQDWRTYGFHEPVQGGRWVRYYDDAVLVDGYGRVVDVRHGLDWDEYGEPWEYDPRGIPVYVGDGDYYPGPDDYAYVESYDGRAYAEAYDDEGYYEDYDYGYAHGGYGGSYSHGYYPPPPPGYWGYGSYRYGHGWGGVTITETTVTTTHGCCAEEKVVVQKPHRVERRHYKRKPVRGERG